MANDTSPTTSYASSQSASTATDQTTSIPNTGDAPSGGSQPSDTTTTSTTNASTANSGTTDGTQTKIDTSTTTKKTVTALPIYVKDLTIETDLNVSIRIPATATNVVGTATWSVDGDIPDGLHLDTATGTIEGAITGAPMQDIILLKVVDSNGTIGSAEYTFIVNPALGAKGDTPLVRYVGYSINTTVTGTGGSGNYTYSIEDCPAGVAINELNGTLSGTFSTAGAHTLVVCVDDGITVFKYPVTFNMAVKATAPVSDPTENFTRRRMAAIGMAKLAEYVKLRSQPTPNYVKSAQDLLAATRFLCQDDTNDIIQAFADVHKTYANTFLREEIFTYGMENFALYDLNFVFYVYQAFRAIIHYHDPKRFDYNQLMTYTRSQRIKFFLEDYQTKYEQMGIG